MTTHSSSSWASGPPKTRHADWRHNKRNTVATIAMRLSAAVLEDRDEDWQDTSDAGVAMVAVDLTVLLVNTIEKGLIRLDGKSWNDAPPEGEEDGWAFSRAQELARDAVCYLEISVRKNGLPKSTEAAVNVVSDAINFATEIQAAADAAVPRIG
jgi:hypothetical protein